MSFMFNPYPYQDMTASNQVTISKESEQSVVVGNNLIGEKILALADKGIVAMDGYIGVDWSAFATEVANIAKTSNIKINLVDISRCYKSSDELDDMLAQYLPVDLTMDPVSLFGKGFEGDIVDLLDMKKVEALKTEIQSTSGKVIVYGCGCSIEPLQDIYQTIFYCDMAPINVVLRAKENKVCCIGDDKPRPFKELMRHLYYIDYEVAIRLRQNLLLDNKIDYYIDCNVAEEWKMLSGTALSEVFNGIVEKPFRCKPCYIEGVWGGDYIKNLRNLPREMRNCAWVFDLIPNEVSLLADVGETVFEFPFIMFYRRMGEALMGKPTQKKFGGVFPIRFNYDDTYHGGNMSIQIHPPCEYNNKHFNEPFQQDESYYVVFTAGSRTYVGLKDETDTDEFFEAIKKSEKDGSEVDYEHYVNSVVSRQGRQLLLPGGTIHSSGKNQVVLEIGSWTIGSYTFKLYDYLRKDFDGKPRPIHSKHGINVFDTSRREEYVQEKLVPKRKLVREGKQWAEYIIGEHEKIFFQLRCLEFYKEITDDTAGQFHVLNLVEGQRVRIEAKIDPDKFYEINYLEMAVVPACLGEYRIRNLGAGPVTVHKTLVKPEVLKNGVE